MLEQLEKAEEEKKKIVEKIAGLKNKLASLENSNNGHQRAAPSQHGHGPKEHPHTDEERVDVSLENRDRCNEEGGEEEGEQQQQQQTTTTRTTTTGGKFSLSSLSVVDAYKATQETRKKRAEKNEKLGDKRFGGRRMHAVHQPSFKDVVQAHVENSDALPGQAVELRITTQKPKETCTNAEIYAACVWHRDYILAGGKNVTKARKQHHPNVPTATLYRYFKNDKYLELESTLAKPENVRDNGGKIPGLSDQFIHALYIHISAMALTDCPVSTNYIKEMICAELIRVGAKRKVGKRKLGEKMPNEAVEYKRGDNMDEHYRMALRRMHFLGLHVKSRPTHTKSVGRCMQQDGEILEDFTMLMNHVIEHLSEKLFVSKQKIFTIGHIVNVDEAQLKLYELDNEIVVVPSDTKVNRVVPSEKLRHVTLVYATLGDQLIAVTVIVTNPNKNNEVVFCDRRYTEAGQFARYASSPNGWCEKDLKQQTVVDIITRVRKIKADEPILVVLDGHWSNLYDDLCELLRSFEYGYVIWPSKTTAYLQPADATNGIISLMAKILKKVANDWWFKQKMTNGRVTEIPVNTLVEDAIKQLLNDDQSRVSIKKSYEKCGFEEINEQDAIKEWLATHPEKRPLVPIGVKYNPLGRNNINMAFNGPEKGSQNDKTFANTDKKLLDQYFQVFKDKKEKLLMNQKKKTASASTGFQDVTQPGIDLTLATGPAAETVRRKNHNELAERRKRERSTLKRGEKSKKVVMDKAGERLAKAKKERSTFVNLEAPVKNLHVELMRLVLKKEEVEAAGIPWPLLESPALPPSQTMPVMTNTNDVPDGSSAKNDEPMTTLTVQGLGVLLENQPEQLARLGKLAVEKAKSSGLLKTNNDLLVYARLIGIDNDDSLRKTKRKSGVEEKVFSQDHGRFWTPGILDNVYSTHVEELNKRIVSEQAVFDKAKHERNAFSIANADVLIEDDRDLRQKILTDRERQERENRALELEAEMMALKREQNADALIQWKEDLYENNPEIFVYGEDVEAENLADSANVIRHMKSSKHFRQHAEREAAFLIQDQQEQHPFNDIPNVRMDNNYDDDMDDVLMA